MAKTLLAVDDSVTMRKVLEITFSGEDFRVITADNTQNALGKLNEGPSVLVVDTALGGEDGYALAKELRKRNPAAAIIMLASRYAPYDQGRGRDAGADDWADKPFDTQQLIDKVRKVLVAKEAGAPAPVPVAAAAAAAPFRAPVGAPAGAPFGAPAAAAGAPFGAPAAPATAPMAAGSLAGGLGRGTQPSLGGNAPARTGTLVFGEGSGASPFAAPAAARPAAPAPAPIAPAPIAASPAPPPVVAPPAPPAPPPVAAAPAAASPVSAAVNGHLAGKLGDLGLTSQQAEAVLALSREVVERVVWEVVPQLAETLIKEELARLTRD